MTGQFEAKVFPPSSPETILVVGMHRSGTSVVARAINAMGAFVGDEREIMVPNPDINPTGYWERPDIVIEHERFLQKSGFAWGTLANFDLGQVDADKRRDLAATLRGIVGRMGQSASPLLIKDPRLCLVLPIWHEALATPPAHVVVVRDPRKIATSLMAAFPDSFTSDFVLALWQKYMQAALAPLGGERVLFVSYARLLEDPAAELYRLWQGLNALGIGGLAAFDGERLRAMVDGGLDRSEPSPQARMDEDRQRLSDWLDRQCLAAGPVEVADVPACPPPDGTLRELERVRGACMRNGWNLAMQNKAAAAEPAQTGAA